MRILVNAFSTLGRRTGIGHYTAELLRSLCQQVEPGEEIACFPTGPALWLGRLWAKVRPLLSRGEGGPQGAASRQRPASILNRWRAQTLGLARRFGQGCLARNLRQLLARQQYDLYHEPNAIPLPCDHPTVTTLPDLSVVLHPEWHPAGRVAYYEEHFLPSLPRSQHFIAISEFTRQEVLRHLNISPERVTRVYCGIRPDLCPLPKETTAATLRQLGLPPQYLLSVGTIEPRKNLLMLLRAYCSLPEELRCRWPLLLVGSWGWNSAEVAGFLSAEGKAKGVIHLGYVAEAHLGALYNGARALLYPSLYEGFGLPPMEMLACGGAVLASNIDVLVETIGSQAHLTDPNDVDAWRAALARIVEDEDWWQELRAGAVEAARPYTWDRCASATLQVYRAVCDRRDQASFRQAA